MVMTVKIVETCAQDVLGWPPNRKWESKDKDERIRSFFGASSVVLVDLWNRLKTQDLDTGATLKHLLWSLVFLKVYASSEVLCAIVGWPNRKTFAKWVWYFVERIAELKDDLIRLEDRFNGLGDVATTNVFISVDGTDCPVFEPQPFSRSMFSQKFNGPGLKYEVAVCLKTGLMVWTNGPFEGSTSDGTIFQQSLSGRLFDDEGVEVDRGYKGDDKMKPPHMGGTSEKRKMKSNARAQQEAMNGRLKQFNVLAAHFRHMSGGKETMMARHGHCFDAVAVITHLKLTVGGESIFEAGLDYDVNYF